MRPEKFKIVCTCNRKICDLERTMEGNLVIYCKTCGDAEVLGVKEA